MKTRLYAVARGLLFAAVFCVLFYLVSCVFSFKYEDGVTTMENYYDLPQNTVDVLLLGSSHIGVNVDPTRLWQQYGIAAYNCWGAMQPAWNTYYYLSECLKTQSPKLVVMDVFGVTFDAEYSQYSYAVKNTQGMRLSSNKLAAVQATAAKDQWAALLLGLPASHTRYAELTRQDFEYFFWNKHTQLQTIASSDGLVYPTTIPDAASVSGTLPLAQKEETYLRKILGLCAEKNVPLELVCAPYHFSDTEQRRYRTIRTVAAEYGVKLYNYNENYQQLGIDPATDFRDEGHLNDSGVQKYTLALGKQWKSEYDLPDRRTDATHIWNQTQASQAQPVYTLPQQFSGDGKQDFVDTGVQLYKNPLSSWTVLAEVEPPRAGTADQVLFSCFDETESDNHGLLVHGRENGAISIAYSSLAGAEIPKTSGTLKLAIVKDGSTMRVFCNGREQGSTTLQGIESYAGSLLIGCQRQADGEKFRFSEVTVHALEVYDTALEAAAVENWTPTLPPAPTATPLANAGSDTITALAERFVGDGLEKYVDTGCALYTDPGDSWTLLAQISPDIPAGDGVYFACFAEQADAYRGLLVRRSEPGKLNILYGGAGTVVDYPTDRASTLTIVKDKTLYTVYLNGVAVVEQQLAPCEAYTGNLLVGCEQDADGNLFRYSGTTVYNLRVVRGVMSVQEIQSWAPEWAPETPEQEGSSAAYQLPHSFAGDGNTAYVNAGVALYDVPEKDWTLNVQLDRDDTFTGTVLSCFAEDPADYRGLLVRQPDAGTLAVTVGQSYTELSLPSGPMVTLTIAKQGFDYTFYLNGSAAGTATSRCRHYDGPLLLGCERTLSGEPFRFSRAKIRRLTACDGAGTAQDAAAFWQQAQN
jgi:hypothetical protein